MFAAAIAWGRALVAPRGPELSYPVLPEIRESGENNVPGLYLAGEAAGTPLIKLGLNEGVRIAELVNRELRGASREDPELLDLFIVGAGSSGLGAACRAHELGLRYAAVDSERMANTVVTMFKGKLLLAEPEDVANESSLWFEECTR
jgi:hypothetical protein